MTKKLRADTEALEFIEDCINRDKIFWTYHVNMRFGHRSISRNFIKKSVQSFEIIEGYPKDKYLPSYLIRAEHKGTPFHILIAVDLKGDNVRVVTSYYPDPKKWSDDFRKRR